ncbi:MBL fold metallo-hydrolase [Fluviibacterium sp. DFM31]|uniref:MBL fold metallo-hydrolase n=1 Tax=Meridianimarinicoccus marinus TaxID=3231483 RepID=A0ABV3L3X3_9RHOB
MTRFTRRQALSTVAAVPLAAGMARPALAAPDKQGAATPSFNRVTLGDFEVTTIAAGAAVREDPQSIFGMNVDAEAFQEVSDQNFLPTDKLVIPFTPTVVNTGGELILFDTGLNPEGTTGLLAQAGISADQVDTVVLTHMHGDHIGGLSTDGAPTYANAKIITGAVEHNYWSGADNDTFNSKVAPLNDQISFLDDGGSVASGVTAMSAFGHTPGHMIYIIESGGKQLAIFADTANHYVWSLGYPDWEVRFDMDKAAAAATRRKVLSMLATDKIPFIGYHMPFPGMGYVETRGDGFRYVPVSYQMML